jgi:hypothetical protein
VRYRMGRLGKNAQNSHHTSGRYEGVSRAHCWCWCVCRLVEHRVCTGFMATAESARSHGYPWVVTKPRCNWRLSPVLGHLTGKAASLITSQDLCQSRWRNLRSLRPGGCVWTGTVCTPIFPRLPAVCYWFQSCDPININCLVQEPVGVYHL